MRIVFIYFSSSWHCLQMAYQTFTIDFFVFTQNKNINKPSGWWSLLDIVYVSSISIKAVIFVCFIAFLIENENTHAFIRLLYNLQCTQETHRDLNAATFGWHSKISLDHAHDHCPNVWDIISIVRWKWSVKSIDRIKRESYKNTSVNVYCGTQSEQLK